MQTKVHAGVVEALRTAREVVVLTGAGVSAESGVPTFRDALTGLWANFDAQALANAGAFAADPALVWGWYEWRRANVMTAQPNPAHHAIAAMAARVPRFTLITQNVDDLHERAGSLDPIHLHGSLYATRCFDCAHPAPRSSEAPDEPADGRRLAPPRCTVCGGYVRPGVVWFGETLPDAAWQAAVDATNSCDLLFSIGTSALVHPAADLPIQAVRHGAVVIQINPQPTALDHIAHFNLLGPAGEVLPSLMAATWGA